MNLLGLDPATVVTGFSVFQNDILEEYGTFVSNSKETNPHMRILQIIEQIEKKVKEKNIDIIVMEEVPLSAAKNLKVAHDLCVLQGAILFLCKIYNLQLQLYMPSEWRRSIGTFMGTKESMLRDFQKQKAVEIVNQKFNLNLKYFKTENKQNKSEDDEAEAILIASCFLKEVYLNVKRNF